jgi:putative acetyltransferase
MTKIKIFHSIDRMDIIQANNLDLKEIQILFSHTVQEVCKKDYNSKQIEIWVSSIQDENRWLQIFKNQFIIKAIVENKIVGFGSLDNFNFIDLLYVHKDYQGKGIAKRLLENLEKEAILSNSKQLTTEASITAKSFFAKNGFQLLEEQFVERKGVLFKNYKMQKRMASH